MPETISLPHSHKEWPLVKEKLQRLADKSICGPDALASVVQVSPEWGLDKPPMLNVLRKVLGAGDYYTVESFSEDLLPYIAKRALAVEELFPTKDIPVSVESTYIKNFCKGWIYNALDNILRIIMCCR